MPLTLNAFHLEPMRQNVLQTPQISMEINSLEKSIAVLQNSIDNYEKQEKDKTNSTDQLQTTATSTKCTLDIENTNEDLKLERLSIHVVHRISTRLMASCQSGLRNQIRGTTRSINRIHSTPQPQTNTVFSGQLCMRCLLNFMVKRQNSASILAWLVRIATSLLIHNSLDSWV
ncbi:hypothetical protein BASA81_014775 [Batrachochytrium salamandrivorans]|nr:hypothetical protein BASA81_014775 [Batrachochytrium salamandrivorans]